jgi:hypothetical protein
MVAAKEAAYLEFWGGKNEIEKRCKCDVKKKGKVPVPN